MKRKIDGLVRLVRHREFIWFVMITTFLGALAANGVWGWRLAGVLVANWLAVAFAFMINDVEDAEDDALNPNKVKRNPISARDLPVQTAQWASGIVAFLAVLTYSLLGWKPFVIGLTCLAIGFLYSWQRVRLKNIAIVDLASHGMMLAGLQFLAAYFTFQPGALVRWLFPLAFLVAVSMYGELFNELRDLDGDLAVGLKHTASLLGRRTAYWLMISVFILGVGSALVTILWVRLIPGWVLLLIGIGAFVFMTPQFFKIRRGHSSLQVQQMLQKPVEVAAALALMAQFLVAAVDFHPF